MSKKDLVETKEQTSSQSEENFLIQSNIDDLLIEPKKEESLNQDAENALEKQQTLPQEEIKEEEKFYSENQSELNIEIETMVENEEKKLISAEEVEQNISLQKKKLDEVEQSVSKQNSKKSKILNIVFFIVNISVIEITFSNIFMSSLLLPIKNNNFF